MCLFQSQVTKYSNRIEFWFSPDYFSGQISRQAFVKLKINKALVQQLQIGNTFFLVYLFLFIINKQITLVSFV
jgi:hypothetical protein